MAKLPDLENLEDMRDYIETKFSSEFFDARATTTDPFGPQVRWTIHWTPKVPQFQPCEGTIWAGPDYFTSAVPFRLETPEE